MLNRLRSSLDPYILLMFATVALAALAPAHGSSAAVVGVAADAAIVFLFFLYGARLSPRSAWDGLRQWRLHLAVMLSTFVLFPALGLALGPVLSARLPPALSTGVLFLCFLPSTVQSSIAFTSIARGNVPAALCAATASTLLGVFLTPLLAGLLLHTQGVQLSLGVARDIVLQLLAPFLMGQLLRRWMRGWVAEHKSLLGLADRGSILLIIYAAFSRGMADHIWRRIETSDLITLLAVLTILLGAALFATRFIARRVLKLNVKDEIVLQFCGSKKSLASGLPIAGVLFPGPSVALILLPLMLFHQLQLIVCAILARRYGARPEPDMRAASGPPTAAHEAARK